LVRLIGRFFVFTKSEPNDDPVCPNNLQKLWYVIYRQFLPFITIIVSLVESPC
jgi:hypothetical protein